ncbi:unnamed protein product [Boreogadus saida]
MVETEEAPADSSGTWNALTPRARARGREAPGAARTRIKLKNVRRDNTQLELWFPAELDSGPRPEVGRAGAGGKLKDEEQEQDPQEGVQKPATCPRGRVPVTCRVRPETRAGTGKWS